MVVVVADAAPAAAAPAAPPFPFSFFPHHLAQRLQLVLLQVLALAHLVDPGVQVDVHHRVQAGGRAGERRSNK